MDRGAWQARVGHDLAIKPLPISKLPLLIHNGYIYTHTHTHTLYIYIYI